MTEPVATQANPSSAHDVEVDAIAEASQGRCYGQLDIHLHLGRVVEHMRTGRFVCSKRAR